MPWFGNNYLSGLSHSFIFCQIISHSLVGSAAHHFIKPLSITLFRVFTLFSTGFVQHPNLQKCSTLTLTYIIIMNLLWWKSFQADLMCVHEPAPDVQWVNRWKVEEQYRKYRLVRQLAGPLGCSAPPGITSGLHLPFQGRNQSFHASTSASVSLQHNIKSQLQSQRGRHLIRSISCKTPETKWAVCLSGCLNRSRSYAASETTGQH